MGAVTEGTWEAEVSRMPCEGLLWVQVVPTRKVRGKSGGCQPGCSWHHKSEEPLARGASAAQLRLPMPE